jgi:hypothetical protein
VESLAPTALDRRSDFVPLPMTNEINASGVSWAAVIAGAFVAAALSLIMVALGVGLGVSSVSPWSNIGASASTVGTATILWLIFTQIVAAAMGGYLAGRLRTKWAAIHTDEVFFRDTAHGFLVWAVGLVITAAMLTSAAVTLAGGSTRSGPAEMSVAAAGGNADGGQNGTEGYFVDRLLRSEGAAQTENNAVVRAEVGRILGNGLRAKAMPAADQEYLATLVAARTGLSQTAAAKRVSDVLADARQAADATRKAVAHALIWIFIALLIGAFCASYSATIGGRQRDHVKFGLV